MIKYIYMIHNKYLWDYINYIYSIISIDSLTPVSELSELPAKLIWHGTCSETQIFACLADKCSELLVPRIADVGDNFRSSHVRNLLIGFWSLISEIPESILGL